MTLPLKVVGTQVLNSRNEPIVLRGVNAASLEWTSDGQGHILQSVNTAIQEWRANIIRLPLAQDRWFGKAPGQQDEGATYRALVKAIVDTCATQACYIVLDLHWSDCGEWGTNIAQHSMPDQNSVVFWKDCAAAYQNHPAVIFDLYNEPHDVTWDIWLKGGTITDRPNSRRGGPPRTFEAVGMQTLLDAVRATGAQNLVIAGGLDWAYDFSGILDGRQLSDPGGNGVLYANHAYNNKRHSVETWISRMEQAAAKLPVIVSEYGGSGGPNRRAGRFGAPARAASPSGDDWLLHVMQALQDHNWSWIAWDFHPSAGPTLISAWDYTPTPDFGVFVKQALAGTLPKYTPPIASATQAPATNSSPPVAAPPSSSASGPGNDVSGTWEAEFDTQIGKQKYVYEFKVQGDKLTGRAIGDIAGTKSETEIGQAKLSGAEIYFVETVKFQEQEIPVAYRGRIVGDEIKFTRTVADSITEEVVAKRVKDAGAKEGRERRDRYRWPKPDGMRRRPGRWVF
jgi:hypothetical protein